MGKALLVNGSAGRANFRLFVRAIYCCDKQLGKANNAKAASTCESKGCWYFSGNTLEARNGNELERFR